MRIAMIPARGGSKRIKQKNIRDFLGKPIIAYSIEAALKSGCFDKVIVSTDDTQIAQVARQYGAEVPFVRPAELADDFTTTFAVIQHTLSWLAEQGTEVDALCCIYATAPFVTTNALQEGLNALRSKSVSYAFSATAFAFPIQRAIMRNSQGTVTMFSPEHLNTRSQDLPEAYHDAGQFYWGRPDAFMNNVPLFSEAAYAVLLPREQVQDIDTEQDWLYAEKMYQLLHN